MNLYERAGRHSALVQLLTLEAELRVMARDREIALRANTIRVSSTGVAMLPRGWVAPMPRPYGWAGE